MSNILIPTVIFALMSAIFALLLTIADRTVNNYGEVKMTINEEKEYTVEGGSTLLSTLIEEKIFIPSACGGKGTCGYCKVQIDEGGGPVLATEMTHLTEDDLKNNVRLSCQCKVKQDIKIQIPEELFNVREYDAVVENITDLTDVIKLLRFKLPEDAEINFKPGQYVQLKAPIYEGNDEEVYRAYSIASSPTMKNYLELVIGYVPEGIATTYVHRHLTVGDEVSINGPYGDFHYHDNDREMIMVATGTGVAPILSLLNYMKEHNIKRKARFYFGAKTPKDLFMLDYFKELEETLFDFKFIPTLSRVTDDDDWDGERGRVNNAIDKLLEDGEDKEGYLCGNEAMIESVVKSLTSKGVPEELIYYDKF
ncbi:2Fe-2S iron-sulfur cluster binding domain-containing protein [Tissierella sp. Yu-01]|uniref:NADH:ubiquinone reductase (Na(+)-transporting) subunit F n=1 Tax=Tissierella sp. Yu-01 TaxID=3035694 RepID=UPI00240CF4A2|nr:2Fe-2S iron-sulfur cluster binding domain-containing protein [Tissierella sp. Yu-01]WFA09382.1 2Fe-2S iron-sulfur cluster binding domain-containing protein [Tissierella sp. Yu-01]